ncbi:MAG: hypothetical protein IT449_16505 [Phycisphaerales bacterium]|nr:hypothetical protein [Phycisphaerales bacterium]
MSETRIILKSAPVARIIFSTDGGLNIFSSSVLTRLDEAVREVRRGSAGRA